MLLSLPLHRSQIVFFPFLSHQSLHVLHLSLQLNRLTVCARLGEGRGRGQRGREKEREREMQCVNSDST